MGALFIWIKPAIPVYLFWPLVAGVLAGWWKLFQNWKKRTYSIAFLLLFCCTIWFTLQLTPVQNWLVGTVTKTLSTNTHTTIRIKHINFHFFDKLNVEGLLVEDQHKDTLLYAGSARVNVTDWFFAKDKITLHYIGLSNAVINLHRTDTVWNYQFLADYFSGDKKKTAKKENGIVLDLKQVELENIRFNKIDGWVGKDMKVAVNKLQLEAKEIDFNTSHFRIKSLNIDRPVFAQYEYDGERDKRGIVVLPNIPNAKTTAYQWNNNGTIISVDELTISNGSFINDKATERAPYADHFDGAHLNFDHINAHMQQLLFEKDTMRTQLLLSTKERSGLEVKKLQARMKFTPEQMEFAQLDLITNRSHLGPYYSMGYESFNRDMGDFLHAVHLKAQFNNSELNSDDLAIFAPDVKNWKRIFSINGNASGTIDNLTARQMKIKSGNSSIDGDLTMKGLPDINTTFIDLKLNDFATNYTDAAALIPALKNIRQPNLASLGNVRYKGNFTGFISDFVTYGTINTNLGTIVSDINLKLPANQPAQYAGKISTQGFQLGRFINTNTIGNITFSGKVNGRGFTAETLKANFDGNVNAVTVGGYTYQNISIKGDFAKNKFQGQGSIQDPNLQLADLHGSIDFSGKDPVFDFSADLTNASLKKLRFTTDNLVVGGQFNFKFAGSNIDNFLGTAGISHANITLNGQQLLFDSLLLQSSIAGNQKKLTLQSNQIDASVIGRFNIRELPDAFKVFLSRYYPTYIQKPSYQVSDQDFSFNIVTRDVTGYLPLIDPKMGGLNDASINGNLQLKQNQLMVNAVVPNFIYDKKTFNNIRLNGQGNLDTLIAKIDVDDVVLNDSLHLPATHLLIRSHNDISDISIKTSASKTLSDASVYAQVQTLSDGVNIHFYPSSFIINDKKWQLEKDGELSLRKSMVSASEIKFIQGNQQIKIATELAQNGTDANDIVVNLTNVNLDDFTPLLFKNPRLEGQVTGTVTIGDAFGKPYIDYDATIQQFSFEKDSIGLVKAKGIYNSKSGIATFKVNAPNTNNNFSFEGSYNSKDSTGNQLNVALVSQKLDLSLLNTYLGGLFSNIQGYANTSDFKVYGNPSKPTITGTANITEGAMTVNYTQCRYKFTNETIIFNPGEIDFGNVVLKDALGNTGTLSGKMYHQFFQNIVFDNIHIETPRLLVLNTTKKDNKQFYGKVIGKADLTLTGDESDMYMKIKGEPSTADSSHIYIVGGNSVESQTIDYIDFIQFGTEMDNRYQGKTASNFVLDMDLTANQSCKIDVVLDEVTGDIIKGTGDGLLQIRVGTKEDLTIKGTYNIAQGEYTFNFQTFLQKYFKVNSGTISWNGDPFQANINITAEYLAQNIDFSSLAAGSSSSISTSTFNKKSDLRILANLTETLLKPKIDFELKLPDQSILKQDFYITKRLQQFEQDKNDLNKQVTSLLLFGAFLNTNSDQGLLTASNGINLISGTIGGVVSNLLSGFFNNLLFKNSKTSIYVDLNGSVANGRNLQANVAQLQAAAKTGVVIKVLQGRIIITAGVNVDLNNPYVVTNNNVFLTPDITAEFIISKDGKFRIIAFNKTNYDLIGQRNRTGTQISYRKEMDKLSDLFKKSGN